MNSSSDSSTDTAAERKTEETSATAVPGKARFVFSQPGSALLTVFKSAAQTANSPMRWPARLFRAGAYPDKNITITRDDLDTVIARFNAASDRGETVPVKTEHQDTPLDPLGEIVALWREDDCLYAMFAFSAHLAKHLQERGVKNVSAAFAAEPTTGGFRLMEASLVLHPRIPDAGFVEFRDDTTSGNAAASDALERWRLAGKVTPAMEGPLRRLLAAPLVIGFTDGATLNVATEITALMDALPTLLPRGAAVPASPAALVTSTTNDPVRTVADRFGVSAEKVAERM